MKKEIQKTLAMTGETATELLNRLQKLNDATEFETAKDAGVFAEFPEWHQQHGKAKFTK